MPCSSKTAPQSLGDLVGLPVLTQGATDVQERLIQGQGFDIGVIGEDLRDSALTLE